MQDIRGLPTCAQRHGHITFLINRSRLEVLLVNIWMHSENIIFLQALSLHRAYGRVSCRHLKARGVTLFSN